jgi:endo-1,4-beta-xylanase
MKWARVHPKPGTYDFELADRFVEFGEEHNMFIVGHTLVWHSQTPDWVFENENGNPVSRDTLLQRMRDHIFKVVNRYDGRVDAWDVVNEAVTDDGSLRESPWLKIIGDDYIEKAFRYAHEADPDAELYYNDYSLTNPSKRSGTVKMIERLRSKGVPISGVGLQSHHAMKYPTLAQQDSAITDFAALGIDVMITELDIAVLPRPDDIQGAEISAKAEGGEELNPYPDALPDSVQQALAQRYADFFEVYLDHRDAINRVTFWGVTDADSWLNDWPIPDRTSYPLLFDRYNEPKPAFDAVVQTAREAGVWSPSNSE